MSALAFLDTLLTITVIPRAPIPPRFHALAEAMAALEYDPLAIFGACLDAERGVRLADSDWVDEPDLGRLEGLAAGE